MTDTRASGGAVAAADHSVPMTAQQLQKQRTAALITAAQWAHAFQYALTFPAQSQLLFELFAGNFARQARAASLLLSVVFGGGLLLNPVRSPRQCAAGARVAAPRASLTTRPQHDHDHDAM